MIDLGLNKQNVALSAKRINKGDSYGPNSKRVHEEDDPFILFYHTDTRSHISTYYRSTLMGECKILPSINKRPAYLHGVCLCGATYLSATAEQVTMACGES